LMALRSDQMGVYGTHTVTRKLSGVFVLLRRFQYTGSQQMAPSTRPVRLLVIWR
jgi:hypothetical protein